MQAPLLNSLPGITLIPVAIEHAQSLAALVGDSPGHLQAYMPALGQLSSVETATAHLLRGVKGAPDGGMLDWHVFFEGALCGGVRLKEIDEDDQRAQIGYFIGHQFGGRGIMSAAVQTVLEYGFGHLALNRIELRCASGNLGSIRMAERMGFVLEGTLRQHEFLHGAFVDQRVYGLLASEFGAASACP